MTVADAARVGRVGRLGARAGRWSTHNLDTVFGCLMVALLLAVALVPGVFTRLSPDTVNVQAQLLPPSVSHWFGTDNVGRDVFARVIYGTRQTLSITITAVIISAVIGTVGGVVSGYYRRGVDTTASRVIDVVLSFPPLILGVIVTGTLGPQTRNLVAAIAVIYLPTFFRVARSATLSEAEKLYVEAGQALGYGTLRIVLKHILRNVLPGLAAQTVVVFPIALQIEAALSFIGLGVQPPTPDWGNILNEGANYLLSAPWIALFPGVAILATAVTAFLLGHVVQRWANSR